MEGEERREECLLQKEGQEKGTTSLVSREKGDGNSVVCAAPSQISVDSNERFSKFSTQDLDVCEKWILLSALTTFTKPSLLAAHGQVV